MDNYSEGLASGLAIGSDRNNGNNGFGWGGDWAWLIILFALFGGWGNNGGFGWGGNNCGCNGNLNYELGKVATSNDVAVGFAQNATLSSLNDLKLGQAGIQQTLCQGFSGVNTAIAQNGYETRLAVNDLGYRMQQCCCDLGSQIQNVNYNIATQGCAIQNTINTSTRDIIDSQRDGTNAILNFLTQDKISTLQAENQALKFQASQTAQNAFITANQEAQTAEIIRRLGRDCPVPSYLVPNPNCCYTPNFSAYNNGCGCGGCGCGC
jgi:hypothetical protein